jgi:hypothetical protein
VPEQNWRFGQAKAWSSAREKWEILEWLWRRRAAGETLDSMAADIGVTRERIRQMLCEIDNQYRAMPEGAQARRTLATACVLLDHFGGREALREVRAPRSEQ